MPRRTIVKIYPQYDDKVTLVEAPAQRVSSPERSDSGTSTTTLGSSNVGGPLAP